MIDMFTKFATVVPVHGKDSDQCSLGIIQGIHELYLGQGVKKPSIIYCDDEAGWAKGAVPEYLEEQGIKQYITRNHAQFAERFIRTYKGMLYKKIDSVKAGERRTRNGIHITGTSY